MSESEYTISQKDDAPQTDIDVIWNGLAAYNRQFVRDHDYERLRLFVRDTEGKIVGGLVGQSFWGWLHIELLWLDESVRGQGYGSRLVALAEDEGRKRDCRYIFLATLSFQARPFYERHGYEVYATMDDYPLGHTRWWLKKML